jgi:hypothetical protein
MVKSEDLSDELRLKILQEELARYRSIVKGHEKLIDAIGRL